MKHPYRELIIAMTRTGILGFGGGPSVIPLIRHEAVDMGCCSNDSTRNAFYFMT